MCFTWRTLPEPSQDWISVRTAVVRWRKVPLALSAQHQDLAAKLYQMSRLIREWDVRGDVMFFPGLCSAREPFNSMSLQLVPAYIHLWMHLTSLFCCLNSTHLCSSVVTPCLPPTVYESRASFSVLTGCFQPFPSNSVLLSLWLFSERCSPCRAAQAWLLQHYLIR